MKMNDAVVIFFVFALVLIGFVAPSQAYQVWTSACKTPNIVLKHFNEWDVVAANLGGFNANFAPTGYEPKSYKPSSEEWEAIIAQYTTARHHVFQPYAHPDGPFTVEHGSNFVNRKMKRARDWGYTLEYIMLYDKGYTTEAGKKYIKVWTDKEITLLRDWLDANGYKDIIKLIFNARSLNAGKRIAHPGIYAGLNEGSTEHWRKNKADRHALLRWVTTDKRVKDKPFFFQITVHHDFKAQQAYENTRLLIRSISQEILGSTDWIRTDKAIFLPMTYNDFPEQFPFLPEHTPDGKRYGNSMAGLLCSLIEQKALFEGRCGEITEDMCKSFARSVPAGRRGLCH